MSIGTVAAIMMQSFGLMYTWLNSNIVSPFLAFTRGFEFAIIFIAAALFLATSVFVLLKQAKKLPKSYAIEIVDLYGENVSIDGVRQIFSTYDAAESYARFYRDKFPQYKFKVVGLTKRVSATTSKS
jgi:hypothetical protein